MIIKEAPVENLRDGNVIMVGEWAGYGGYKARVHRVRSVRDEWGCQLYEVLFTMIESPLKKMDQIIYPKGYKMTLVF